MHCIFADLGSNKVSSSSSIILHDEIDSRIEDGGSEISIVIGFVTATPFK